MFVFSVVVVVYLPHLAARPRRRPTPRVSARGVFALTTLLQPAHRLTTTAPARIHAQRAHRSHQAALGVPTTIATPTPLPRPRHVTAYPNDAHLRAHLRAPPPLPITFNTPLTSASPAPARSHHAKPNTATQGARNTRRRGQQRTTSAACPSAGKHRGDEGGEGGREDVGSGYDGEWRASSPSSDAVPASPAQCRRASRGGCTRTANHRGSTPRAPFHPAPALAAPALNISASAPAVAPPARAASPPALTASPTHPTRSPTPALTASPTHSPSDPTRSPSHPTRSPAHALNARRSTTLLFTPPPPLPFLIPRPNACYFHRAPLFSACTRFAGFLSI
ncbi:hypothetical protein PLICRDRAFT_174463 [Plicaturopsis crispa FD-325 SS-3]|nr:hypothetical protein PLICRDRAFT_174463 [Plicaturopsis crispa FD-325 SS-3]